jgi:hypothetical protein
MTSSSETATLRSRWEEGPLVTSAAAAAVAVAVVGCSLSVDELVGVLALTAVVEDRVLSLVDSLRTLHNREEE